MRIENLQITDLSSTGTGRQQVTVILDHADDRLSLRASAAPGTRDINRALVDDALRQLRQMPEYRRAETGIDLSDRAWAGLAAGS